MIKEITENECKNRWMTPERKNFLDDIIKGFKKGKIPKGIDQYGRYNDRIDLRGLPLSQSIVIKNIVMENVDLSFSDFENAWIEDSMFKNVLFNKANLRSIADHGNEFHNVTFLKTDLGAAVLGYKGSKYRNCVFDNVVFRKTGFIRAEFDQCIFKGRFKEIDFNVSFFSKCRFVGELHDVWFRGGYVFPGDTKDYGSFKRNTMNQVDFSDATLSFLTFTGGVSLNTVLLPHDPYTFYMNKLPDVLPLAKKLSEAKFKGKDLEAAEIFFKIKMDRDIVSQPETIFTLRDYEEEGVSDHFIVDLKNVLISARERIKKE